MIHAVQQNVSWRAIPVAGIVAGTFFLIMSAILTTIILDIEIGLLLRYFGSLVLGPEVLTSSSTAPIVVGVVVHYVLSLIYTLVIALVVHRWGFWVGVIGGGLLGAALYGINLYTMTLFFDWFFAIDSTSLLASHIAFGAAAGGVYELFDHFDMPVSVEVSNENI